MSSHRQSPPSVVARLVVGLLFVATIAGGIALAGLASRYASWSHTLAVEADETFEIVIPHGTNWSSVVERLEDAGVIERPLYFDYWARRRGLPARVKAGAYVLEGPLSLDELGEVLARGGAFDEVSVTIPEGFSIFHIADRLQQTGLADRDDFLAAATDSAAMAEADIEGESFEGYLFPDTYRFRKATPADQIVARLHDRWREVWSRLESEHQPALEARRAEGFTRHELVTLASLVERESAVADERPLIARVFYNRLKKGMRLQTDPTCVYGEETYLDIPSPAACRDRASRYSTYVITGLPPGPIANPGAGALRAALLPSTEDGADELLYFVARRDGSGTHHFSRTLREHEDAIDRYLR